MDQHSNLSHWENWANTFGMDLSATTKCMTIKRIEVDAFTRAIKKYLGHKGGHLKTLEIGCGNGFNALGLSNEFPMMRFIGVDFSATMIEHAKKVQYKFETEPKFGVADARELKTPFAFDKGNKGEGAEPIQAFDLIYTDRMLINLASATEQLAVMKKAASLLNPGGIFMMIENSVQSHARLNTIRNALGLPKRDPASYNIFIDEVEVIERFKSEMNLISTEYISGIHDLMLYAVAPAIAAPKGEIQYDTPMMKTLTEAILALRQNQIPNPEGLGQNVLWIWQKR